MRPDKRRQYEDGEMWIGASSWNSTVRSVKYAYIGKDCRISRGSPEVRIKDLVAMLIFAIEEGEASADERNLILHSLETS